MNSDEFKETLTNTSVRTQEGLRMMQALPLSVKIRMTQARIREWVNEFGEDGVYVSVSGGKDSQVLADIVDKMYPDSNIPKLFVNTGLEWVSVRKKGEEIASKVVVPQMSFVDVITKYGYPVISKEVAMKIADVRIDAWNHGIDVTDTHLYQRCFNPMSEHLQKYPAYSMARYSYLFDAPFLISDKCCREIKKKPSKGYEKETYRHPIVGTMADESRARRSKWIENGCNAYDLNRPMSSPLSFWTDQDVLQYVKDNNLKLADIYGDVVHVDEDGFEYDTDYFGSEMKLTTTGAKRTGCVFCLFGITQDKERLLRLKSIEPKRYDFVMRGGKFNEQGMWIPDHGLGYRFIIDWLNEHGNLGIKY